MVTVRFVVLILVACTGCRATRTEDVSTALREADRLAWMTNWTAATPVFVRAENIARDAGDDRNALYAKFGRLRGEMQVRPLPDVSAEIARDLESDLAKSDAWLRLRGLTAKGDIDLEWDVPAARETWQQVLQLATTLKHDGWVNRAKGDLGMIAFLQGDSRQAGAMVAHALQSAAKSGDVGGQLRYLGAIGAGLLLAGDPPAALGYVDKALEVARQHPDVGFPYSQVPMSLIREIMSQKYCEVFSYLNCQRLVPYLTDPLKAAGITAAFGDESWRAAITATDRQQALISLYTSALKATGKVRYPWAFAMFDADGHLIYWLVFSTNDLKGLEVMKKAMWKVDASGAYRFSDRNDPRQQQFFSTLTDDWLADELTRRLKGRTLSEDAVQEFVLTQTPFYRYKDPINILRKRGNVSPSKRGSFPVTFA